MYDGSFAQSLAEISAWMVFLGIMFTVWGIIGIYLWGREG